MPFKNNRKNSAIKVPASAPVSPVATRSYFADAQKDKCDPVTPQRLSRDYSLPPAFSPVTPATNFSTPYTPLTSASYTTSSNGSYLATPSSVSSTRKLGTAALLQGDIKHSKVKSLADIAENWRSRANENGIRVSLPPDDPHYADDEASDNTTSDAKALNQLTTKEKLLPPPLFSSHRRARAQTQVTAPTIPLSSQHPIPQTPARRTFADAVLNYSTPSPKLSAAQHLKFKGSLTEPAQPRRRTAMTSQENFDLISIDNDTLFAPYPQFASPMHHVGLPITLNDPFLVRDTPSWAAATQQHSPPLCIDMHNMSVCSVCGRSSGPLAVLEPCGHPLCSSCLTSALNIVGEKDISCAVCKIPVDNFQLRSTSQSISTQLADWHVPHNSNSPLNAMGSDTFAKNHLNFLDNIQGSSTPVIYADYREIPKAGDYIVLRIDNVPWDITPPIIYAWLKHPVVRVHVLLDRRGKTLSHAFVEVANEEIAKAALRTAQNSVLGKGKRARGVTVTRSSQEELMRALFPGWRGSFDGSRPSLAGLSNDQVISTLETGLISESELRALFQLIRSPDSHFLKVSSLPFHCLISILSKFPADIDSRVFWSGPLRDVLYDITLGAMEILYSRCNVPNSHEEPGLLVHLAQAGMACDAFTDPQHTRLSELAESILPPGTSHSLPSFVESKPLLHTYSSVNIQSQMYGRETADPDSFGALAREFGVEPNLVQALAQRLSGIC